jgi:rhodanese-related sulfurtransferase
VKSVALQLLAIGGLVVAATLGVYAWHPNRPALYFDLQQLDDGEVDLAQALEWRDAGQIVWIDARSREKYDAGHLEGAMLLNERDDFNALLLESFAELQNNSDKNLVVYCGSATCAASLRIAKKLRGIGFHSVHVLKGGVETLLAGGLLGE